MGLAALPHAAFAAIGGHIIGILIPESFTAWRGIPENVYWWFSAAAGTLAAVLVIGGIVILAGRRLLVPRVRAATSPIDYLVLILLLLVVLTGTAPTLGVNMLGGGYDYRDTVGVWFRGLFTGQPNAEVMVTGSAHLPDPRRLGLGDLGGLAVQPVRARMELPAVVSVAALHHRPQPPRRAPDGAGHGAQVAQDRHPLLTVRRAKPYAAGLPYRSRPGQDCRGGTPAGSLR